MESPKRLDFYRQAVAIANDTGAEAVVVAVEDGNNALLPEPVVRGGTKPDMDPGAKSDALMLLTERIHKHSKANGGAVWSSKIDPGVAATTNVQVGAAAT